MQRSSVIALVLVPLLAALVLAGLWMQRGESESEDAQSELPLVPVAPRVPEKPASVDRIARVELNPCPEARAPLPLHGRIELRLFAGAGIEGARMREVESAARRYWGRYGVEIAVLDTPLALPHASMFSGSFAELEAKHIAPAQLSHTLYADVRAFLHSHALPPTDALRVVVVRDIVHPSAAAAAVIGDLMGLTLAPRLLHDGAPESAAILAALELEAGAPFSPTIFLSERHLLGLGPEAFVAAVAHEIGHALGLRHVQRATNLMAAERPACLPDLDPAQLDALRSAF